MSAIYSSNGENGPSPLAESAPAPRLVADEIAIEYEVARGATYRAVSSFSLEVDSGSFVCVVGPSGCGKSSILNAVAGLVPCSAGTLLIDGHPVVGCGPDRAVVFQEPSLLPWRTVMRNVAYGLELRGDRKADARAQAQKMIDLVGLNGFEDRYPAQLSGGMKQRVNLARALAMEPEVLLLDEPFASLDAQTRTVMQTELLRIWEASRTTALFVTHQIDEAVLLGDRVVVLSEGPGSVVAAEIPVGLPRPRSALITREPEFLDLTDRIWKLIRSDAVDDR